MSPNAVTFVGLLTACSHGGVVREGCRLFNEMIHKYSIKPQPEHYACLVDILARVGLLDDALAVILSLPFEPDEIIWGALLAASKRCRRLDMAKQIVERLAVVQPGDPSRCVLLANAHASDEGQWNVARDVRVAMCNDGSKKVAGRSWIEIEGRVNYFTSGCNHHPKE
ncbi:hypothetical protein HPP92_018844 [Vanilla planifolia]|uniref:Pentatricopeptide repeat-containing protein n=1 Tax=Vanilla planifolia TaxID=51239 RepID=A0A835UL47_VANPL|nr:hypothetical protein HPP92_018844 [Vanilla planifolia]